ncbi:MAG: homoserine O-succinyltransferase [Lachnospiraceae bacterium]|jgi:homoserine O-succinyltransferase|nr:homoserine O-succinyltransferase [Lachnospiraceae bacterium]MEE3461642.1 homoserine O-succinyltransferase [Lachnospiraceae bacterium]
MPIKVKDNLPAKKVMEEENIFMMDEIRANSQDIRPLNIVILNLMPLKEDTEIQFLRMLSNTPLQIQLTFLTTATHKGTNTPQSHIDEFYQTFDDIRDKKFDGMVITGAPVETMDFEEVDYWDELKEIMEWSKTFVTSTLHICWGAQAGLYYHYGIRKYDLGKKLFGIYNHRTIHRKVPFVRGFDDEFYAPNSRYTGMVHEDIVNCPDLTILVDSKDAGDVIIMDKSEKMFFVMSHLEYDRMTLDKEYKRDIAKGMDIDIPYNYYPDDDPTKRPLLKWRATSEMMYSNWLNYYVYQNTPYKL